MSGDGGSGRKNGVPVWERDRELLLEVFFLDPGLHYRTDVRVDEPSNFSCRVRFKIWSDPLHGSGDGGDGWSFFVVVFFFE